MDDNSQDMDNLFQKAAQKHSELPSSEVWAHLEKDLQKRNVTSITKKYKKWKWMALVLFIFSISIGIYSFHITRRYNDAINNIKLSNTHPGNTHSSSMGKSSPGIQSHPNKSDNLVADKTSKEKNEVLPAGKNVPSEINPIAKTDTLKNDETSFRDTNKHQKIKTGDFNHAVMPSSANAKNSVLKKTNTPATRTKEATEKTLNAGNTQPGNIAHKSVVEKNPLPGNKVAVTTTGYSAGLLPIDGNVDLKPALVDAPPFLLTYNPDALLSLLKTDPILLTVFSAKAHLRAPARSINRKTYTATISYSLGTVSNHISSNHPDFREDNYQQIKNHEKNRLANTIELSLVRNIGRHLGIESGIGQTNYITDIYAKPLVARKDNSGNVNYRISASSGYAYYTVKNFPRPAIADSIRTVSSKSTVKYVSVPLGLLYYFNFRRFEIAPSVLVSANFKSTAKIKTVQSPERTYTSDVQGLKSTSFDGIIRLGVHYYINKTIAVSLIPDIRFGLSGATEGNPVKMRRSTAGLGAGINLNF